MDITKKIDFIKNEYFDLSINNGLLNVDMNGLYKIDVDTGDISGKPLDIDGKLLGNNSTSLVVGLVRWNGSVNVNSSYLAPLMIIPVSVDNSVVTCDESDLLFNYFLKDKLEKQGVNLPVFESTGIDEYMSMLKDVLKESHVELVDNCYLAQFNITHLEAYNELLKVTDSNKGLDKLVDTGNFKVNENKAHAIDNYEIYDWDIDAASSINSDNSFIVDYHGERADYLLTNILAQIVCNDKKALIITNNNPDDITHNMNVLNVDNCSSNQILDIINSDDYKLTDYSLFTEYDYITDRLNQTDKALKDIRNITGYSYEECAGIIKKLEDNYDNIPEVDTRGITKDTFDLIRNNLDKYRQINPTADMESIDKEDLNKLINSYNDFTKTLNEITDITGTNIHNDTDFNEIIGKYELITPRNIRLYKHTWEIGELIDEINTLNRLKNGTDDTADIEKIDEYLEKIEELQVNPEILEHVDIEKVLSQIKTSYANIVNSKLGKLANDPQLREKLAYFKRAARYPAMELFDDRYQYITRQFTSQYPQNTPVMVIIRDAESVLINRQLLQTAVNQVLPYYAKDKVTAEEIIEILEEVKNDEDKIRKALENKNLEADNTGKIDKLREELESKDKLGQTLLGKNWKKEESDIKQLNEIYNQLTEYQEQYNTGFYTEATRKTFEKITQNDYQILIKNLIDQHDTLTGILGKTGIKYDENEILNTGKFNKKLEQLKQNTDNRNSQTQKHDDKYINTLIKLASDGKIKSGDMLEVLIYNYIKRLEEDDLLLEEYSPDEYNKARSKQEKIRAQLHEINWIRVKEKQTENKQIETLKNQYPQQFTKLENILAQEEKIDEETLSKIKDAAARLQPVWHITIESLMENLPLEEYESFFDYVIVYNIDKTGEIPAVLRSENMIIITENDDILIDKTDKNTFILKDINKTQKVDISDMYIKTEADKYTPVKHEDMTGTRTKDETQKTSDKLDKREQRLKEREDELEQEKQKLEKLRQELLEKEKQLEENIRIQKQKEQKLEEEKQRIIDVLTKL